MIQFVSPNKILVGSGTLAQLPEEVSDLGKRPLLVTGQGGYAAPAQALLPQAPVWRVGGEVTLAMIDDGVELLRQYGCDCLVAVGGGSAIDAAKAVAAMAPNEGSLVDYLEVIGSGQALRELPLPVVAVPTTAGTGAEATMNAVIASPAHRRKVSLRHPQMMPQLVLIDPQLALGLPPAVTAATAMDALTQLIEPFLSSKANALTDALCREMLPRMLPAIYAVLRDGSDISARTDLAMGALSSGLALANAGLGAVHGLAGPMGGAYGFPHGQICAHLLLPLLRLNWQQIQAGDDDGYIIQRFEALGPLLTGRDDTGADDALAALERLMPRLPIPPLKLSANQRAELPDVCQQALSSSSMKGNPVPLSAGQLLRAVESVVEAA